MVKRYLYDAEIDGVTDDNNVALDSIIDLIDDDEIDSAMLYSLSTYEVNIGDELEFYDYNNDIIFAGIVKDIKAEYMKEILVFKYDYVLTYRVPEEIFEEKTIEWIIEYLITNYSDLDYVSTFVSGITIKRYNTEKKNVYQSIKDLIALVPNLMYNVNNSKEFDLFIKGTQISSESLINGENCEIIGGWNQDTTKQVTRLKLYGEKQTQQDKIQTFNGDGTTTEILLDEIPTSIKVEVNSGSGFVELELDVEGQRSGSFNVIKGTKKIIFIDAPVAGSGNIRITYTFSIDIFVEFDANSDIQDKYGIIEKVLTKKHLTTTDSAFEYASKYVEENSEPKISAKFRKLDNINISNVMPGMAIQTIDSINQVNGENINRNLVIKSVRRSFVNGSCIIQVGELGLSGIDILAETQYNVNQLYEQDDNTSIQNKSQLIQNNVTGKASSVIDLALYRDLPDDYMYLADEIGDLSGWWTGDGNTDDRNGNGNDGTWNGLTLNNGIVVGGVTIEDGAMVFDGTGTVNTGNNYVLQSSFSLSFYIKYLPEENTDFPRTIDKGRVNNTNFWVIPGGTGLLFGIGRGTGRIELQAPNNIIADNNLHLATFTYDGSIARLYVDGAFITESSAITMSIDDTKELWFGRQNNNSGNFFRGFLDNILFNNGKVLTLEEHQEIYNAGKDSYSPIGRGLIAQYSGRDFEGTESAPTTILDINNYVKGLVWDRAYNFDGSNQIIVSDTIIGVKSINFFCILYENNTDLIKLSSTAKISINGDNEIVTTGLDNVIITIDNIVTSAVDLSTKVCINLNFDSITCDDIVFGVDSIAIFDDIRFYIQEKNDDEKTSLYNSGAGQRGNANFSVISDGRERPLRDAEGSSEQPYYYITDKDYWGDPNYEIAQTGSLQSWIEIGTGQILLENEGAILLEDESELIL